MAMEATLTSREAAEALGVSQSTLYRYCQEGKLSPKRVGRFKRYPESQIAALLGVEYSGIPADREQEKVISIDRGPADDKIAICKGLLVAFKATRHYSDLVSLVYEQKHRRMETVTGIFENGEEVTVNVSGDSGVSMIRDVIRGLADGGTL